MKNFSTICIFLMSIIQTTMIISMIPDRSAEHLVGGADDDELQVGSGRQNYTRNKIKRGGGRPGHQYHICKWYHCSRGYNPCCSKKNNS